MPRHLCKDLTDQYGSPYQIRHFLPLVLQLLRLTVDGNNNLFETGVPDDFAVGSDIDVEVVEEVDW